MAVAQVAENYGDERGLTWHLRWGIHTSLPTWTLKKPTSNSRNTEFKDILPRNISQMITETSKLVQK